MAEEYLTTPTQDSEQNLNITLAADSDFPDGPSKSFLSELPLPPPIKQRKWEKNSNSTRSLGRLHALLNFHNFSCWCDKSNLWAGSRSKFMNSWGRASFRGSCCLLPDPVTNPWKGGAGRRILWSQSRLTSAKSREVNLSGDAFCLLLRHLSLKDTS